MPRRIELLLNILNDGPQRQTSHGEESAVILQHDQANKHAMMTGRAREEDGLEVDQQL